MTILRIVYTELLVGASVAATLWQLASGRPIAALCAVAVAWVATKLDIRRP